MNRLTIGELAAQSGVRARTIRFYEAKGLLPAPQRSDSGYRLYSQSDLLRLRFIRQARLLGLGLPAIKTLATQAFSADCAAFAAELQATIAQQRAEVERRLTELQGLQTQLEALQRHVAHCCEGCSPEEMAADCDFCGLISVTEGGEK
ncbi:MAG TPA: MerR family transcriptional regulator [Dehalococcoidia bacterium]|nr:MerR family transcriptional regulator [Dehalococcoidia bacterium]